MPKPTYLDHFLFVFVISLLTLASASAIFFGVKTYGPGADPQPSNLLSLQGKFEEEGKVLGGGCSGTKQYIRNNNFDPKTVEATKREYDGKWLVCLWHDDGAVVHTIVADDGSWTTPPLNEGNIVDVEITGSGTFSYHLKDYPNVKGYATIPDSGSSDNSSSSSSSNTTSSSKKTDSSTNTGTTPTNEQETLSDVDLPKTFTAKGSDTTDLSKVKNLKKVTNFTLDVKGKNKIVFKDVLDLSSSKLVDKFKDLDKYVKITEAGKVSIDSKSLPALNSKATITMNKLTHLFEPEILVDGKKDTKDVVSNSVYDKKTGKLTFDVGHFSTFTAAPKIELLEPSGDEVTDPNTLITGRVSDPDSILNARFNDEDITSLLVGVETGGFAIEGVTFQEGENFLTVEAKSDLGKALPLVKTITYQPTAAAVAVTNETNYPLLIVSMIAVLAFLVLLGYLIHRKRKHFSVPKQPQPAPVV